MKPIPVDFNIGSLQIHTYGIGLAITFWLSYLYFERRLRNNGYPTAWLGNSFLWIVLAAVVGARVTHVVSNLNFYSKNPGDILAVWHGGLSSFGGLLFAVPVGLVLAHRRCPWLSAGRGLDLVAPVLMAAWALGRLLGPQVEVAGGGKPTTAWYGLYYAGQVGKRIPAPVFQSIECLVILAILFWIERRTSAGPKRVDGDRGPLPAAWLSTPRPVGIVIASAAALWGLDRFLDEVLWLAVPTVWDLVEVVGLAMCLAGLVIIGLLYRKQRRTPGTLSHPGEREPLGLGPEVDAGGAVAPSGSVT
ncbi:MAG: prolipoprotein diacylglyceryl transferase [Acidimicrobiales bacterium]